MAGFAGGGRGAPPPGCSRVEFPEYRSLLPAERSPLSPRSRSCPLVEAVKRVVAGRARTAPVRLSFSAGELVLEAGAGDEAQAREELDAASRASR